MRIPPSACLVLLGDMWRRFHGGSDNIMYLEGKVVIIIQEPAKGGKGSLGFEKNLCRSIKLLKIIVFREC